MRAIYLVLCIICMLIGWGLIGVEVIYQTDYKYALSFFGGMFLFKAGIFASEREIFK